MTVKILYFALTLVIAAESLAKTSFKHGIFANLESDYDLTSEKDEVDGFDYELFNFTFPMFDGNGDEGHERVKRFQVPSVNNPNPLCIMTFNIRSYTSPPPPGLPRNKEAVIARVSCLLMYHVQETLSLLNRR